MKKLCFGIIVVFIAGFFAVGAALAEGKNGGTEPTTLDKIACQGVYNTCLANCDKPGPFGPGRNASECKNNCDYSYINCLSGTNPKRATKRPGTPPKRIKPTKPLKPIKPIESGEPIKSKK